MTSEIKQATRGRWPGLLTALGVSEEYLTGKHGPCPFCQAGKDRFRFDDKDGEGTFICNACGAGDGFTFLIRWHGWDFAEAATEVEKIVGKVNGAQSKPKRDPRPALQRIQREAVPARQVPDVVAYLEGRGLDVPPTLYGHHELPYYHEGREIGRYPAMLGKVVDPEGKPVTFHRTYLLDGKKAPVPSPRKMMPPAGTVRGAAIRLYPCTDTLVVAEGIETAIACRQLWDLPAWAAISAQNLARFQPPEMVRRIILAGDHDASYAGQAAVYAAAQRLVRDYAVEVRIPEGPGDWADSLVPINPQSTNSRES